MEPKATTRSYVKDVFDVHLNIRTRKEVAQDYFNEVLAGHLVHIASSTLWAKEFYKLCKEHKGQTIYRNFPHDEYRGEYSICPTHHYDEIKVN